MSVSVGTSCSAAITRQGRLYTWGDNAAGQLGRREDLTTKNKKYNSVTGGPGTAPPIAKNNHPPSTSGFPNSPSMWSPASSQRSTQQQQQLQPRSVSPGALYVDAHAPRDFGTPSRGATGGGLGGVDGGVIGTSRFHPAGGQALAPLISQSEYNEDSDDVVDHLGSIFSASPWQALTEGVSDGKGGKMLAMPAARFAKRYSSFTHRGNGGRSTLEDEDDEDDDEEYANPALHFMGHDGGGAPLRASYGRVCTLSLQLSLQ